MATKSDRRKHAQRPSRYDEVVHKARTKTRTIPPQEKGQKKITFKEGGLHESLGVPQGQKIPAKKMAAAKAGKYGAKAKKQAMFAKNVLTGGD
jgi:hypothetical protein